MADQAEEKLTSAQNPGEWQDGEVFVCQNERGQKKRFVLINPLGSGKTSVVWRAKDEETNRELALKVLRTPVTKENRDLLQDEFDVLRHLAELFRNRQISPEERPIPEVYDWRLKGDVVFLAMELAPGKPAASYAQFTYAFSQKAHQIKLHAENWRMDLNRLEATMREVGVTSHAQYQEVISTIQSSTRRLDELSEDWDRLLPAIDALDAAKQQQALTEEELCLIGFQASQVFELLHSDIYRSYKDFQLKNFFLNRGKKQLKIIDWNVLTPVGRVESKQDLFRLAAGLFYLVTMVRVERPLSAQGLMQAGGLAWESMPSSGFRMILERALSPEYSQRYTKAYDWFYKKVGFGPIEEILAFGNALEMLLRYHQACLSEQVKDLLQDIDAWMDQGQLSSAQAALMIIQRYREAKDVVTNQTYLDGLQRKLGKLLEQSGKQQFQDLYGWLVIADDAHNAERSLNEMMEKNPDSLYLLRWREILNWALQLDVQNRNTLREHLPDLLQFIDAHRWQRALDTLQMMSRKIGNCESIEHLQQDFQVNLLLAHLNNQIQMLDQNGEEESRKTVENIEKLQHENKPPYYQQVLMSWPDFNEWKITLDEFRQHRLVHDDEQLKIQSSAPWKA